MPKTETQENLTASQRISNQIAEVTDWRGRLLARLRQLILDTVPGITEEWKWGAAVWSKNGLVCSAAPFKDHVKLVFFQGAALADPQGLFNSGLDAKTSRAIDFSEDDKLNETGVQDLLRAAVATNEAHGKKG